MLPQLYKVFHGRIPGTNENVPLEVYGSSEEPLWLGGKVALFCSITERTMLQWFADWNNPKYAFKMKVINPHATGRQRKTQTQWVVTEAGLMRFTFGARNNIAQEFVDWVLLDIMPTIRKTGRYEVPDQKEIQRLNKALHDQVDTMQKQHEKAVEESRQRVGELTSEIVTMKAALDEKQVQFTSQLNDKQQELDLKQREADQFSCDADKLENDVEELQASIREKEAELADVEEDRVLLAGYLNTYVGGSDLAKVLADNPGTIAPVDTRDQVTMLRCSSFALLHTMSFLMVQGFVDVHGRHMTTAEMNTAIMRIMEVQGVVVERKVTRNWITLYTILASIARARLSDDGSMYSTQMPLFHVYLYTKNLNAWVLEKLMWNNILPYAEHIKAYYGTTVDRFSFDSVEYKNIHPNATNVALITDFFAR